MEKIEEYRLKSWRSEKVGEITKVTGGRSEKTREGRRKSRRLERLRSVDEVRERREGRGGQGILRSLKVRKGIEMSKDASDTCIFCCCILNAKNGRLYEHFPVKRPRK